MAMGNWWRASPNQRNQNYRITFPNARVALVLFLSPLASTCVFLHERPVSVIDRKNILVKFLPEKFLMVALILVIFCRRDHVVSCWLISFLLIRNYVVRYISSCWWISISSSWKKWSTFCNRLCLNSGYLLKSSKRWLASIGRSIFPGKIAIVEVRNSDVKI